MQPGTAQIAAGFVLYGPSTVMALTWGAGTDIYALGCVAYEMLTGQGVRSRKNSGLAGDFVSTIRTTDH